ncbi:SDR family oxidoreductase [Cognatishimia maritima]|uniref:NADP-dependent 3-hydroxy acid dehydrogenase YdfG n=1 Tax=Cognatishimia maritima TaxID=870908 RepID=A0A1M5T0U1_9RHOB|nr:SDR family oxidoreductase [Cognatishimia maritima]SHH44379.1 NADP-dependent 3-hydroxy acid dehydrogenase YdfG [Cognatishimia maritima]
MDLQGKTVMITGASRGIGAAAAREFANAGANVALVARSDAAIRDLADELGANALAIPCDVSQFADLATAVQTCVEHFGGLDVLINNAALLEPIAHMSDADPEAWSTLIDVNVKGVFNGMRLALPQMIAQGAGAILTIGSGAAQKPYEGWGAYCASKAAALMMTRTVDAEAGAKGIRAISLSPGTVATQMQKDIKASGMNPVSKLDWEDHIPPEWVAKTLLWMCGPAADAWCGGEVSLRDEAIRKKVGLI